MRHFAIMLLVGFYSLVHCQEKVDNKKKDFQDWQLRAGPYFWFLGVNTTIENPNFLRYLPVEEDHKIDKSFSQLKNSLKFGLSLNLEYNRKRWIGIVNFASFIIAGEDITTDKYLNINIFYRWEQLYGDTKIGYRFLSKDKFKFDGLIGAHINYFEIFGSFKAGPGDTYSDQFSDLSLKPIIATRLIYIPHYRLEFAGYIDLGYSPKGLTNQYKIDAMVLITKWLYASAGYKYWLIRQNSGESVFDGQFYGFYTRFGVQF